MGLRSLKANIDMVQILDNILEPCFYINSKWELEFINHAAELLFQQFAPISKRTKEEFIGRSIWEIAPMYKESMEHKKIYDAFLAQQPIELNLFVDHSNRMVEIKAFPNPDGVFIMFRDITDRVEEEKQAIFYDKVNTIREMAAGVAHEVRNPITTVKGFLQVMTENNEVVKYKDIYHLMIEEINRVNEIITEFLDIAKDKPSKIENCNINQIIRTLYPLLETRTLKEGKQIALNLSDVCNLNLDQNEIRQLLLNLINNALDAMESNKTVIVNTYEDKDEVVLSIKDEGKGIPSNVRDHIETPFYTTKEHGTGLGLPICYSIAKRNNGKIDFTSSIEGTTFNVRFTK